MVFHRTEVILSSFHWGRVFIDSMSASQRGIRQCQSRFSIMEIMSGFRYNITILHFTCFFCLLLQFTNLMITQMYMQYYRTGERMEGDTVKTCSGDLFS